MGVRHIYTPAQFSNVVSTHTILQLLLCNSIWKFFRSCVSIVRQTRLVWSGWGAVLEHRLCREAPITLCYVRAVTKCFTVQYFKQKVNLLWKAWKKPPGNLRVGAYVYLRDSFRVTEEAYNPPGEISTGTLRLPMGFIFKKNSLLIACASFYHHIIHAGKYYHTINLILMRLVLPPTIYFISPNKSA